MNIKITDDPFHADAITHGGIFHADDVLACVILGKALGDISLARVNRMPEYYKENAIVFDIGGGELDHHQPGGNGARTNDVPYAAAGLMWKKFGRNIVAETEESDYVYNMIDQELIQGIDAIDNGTLPHTDYPAQSMSLSKAIHLFNPEWDETDMPNQRFLEAVDFAEKVFELVYRNIVSKVRAKKVVEDAVRISENNIMVLQKFVPWQEWLLADESEKAGDIHFVIFPSARGGYNWQCVPKAINSRELRKAVPMSWRGLRDEELQAISGVKTAVFCHRDGFIGGADTCEDAKKMAFIAENTD